MSLFSLSVAALAAAAFLLPSGAQAQTMLTASPPPILSVLTPTIIAQDSAASVAYSSGSYANKNGGTGFGAFTVATSVATPASAFAGSFVGTAANSEGGNGGVASIDSSGKSFGTYANGTSTGAGDPSVTVSRTFAVGPTAGGSFSLDFVTGYNDGANGGGSASVALANALGTFGTFAYVSNNTYTFNGTTITGQGYVSGPFHLTYNITSATTYSLTETGPFSFTGAGTFTSPITGFQVKQANSISNPNNGAVDHDAFFNNLQETAQPSASAAPEPSQLGVLLAVCLGGLALAARKRLVCA